MLLHSISTRSKSQKIIFFYNWEITLYRDYVLVFWAVWGGLGIDTDFAVEFSEFYFGFVDILNIMLSYFWLPHIGGRISLFILIPRNSNTTLHLLEAKLIIIF